MPQATAAKPITCAEIARRWLAAGELPLTGAELAEKLTAERRPAGSDRARKYRPHRDQSADRACAEIGGPRFPHRLSAEGVRLQRAVANLRAKRRWKTRSIATRILADAKLEARIQGVAARSRAFHRARSRHDPDPGEISGDRAIAPTPVGFAPSDLQPAFGLVQGDDADDRSGVHAKAMSSRP